MSKAIKRRAADGATEYTITAPDGTVKVETLSADAADFTHVRFVDRGEGHPDGRYLTDLHHSAKAAGELHSLYGTAPVSASPIVWIEES